jgi:hypothetical protein
MESPPEVYWKEPMSQWLATRVSPRWSVAGQAAGSAVPIVGLPDSSA